MATFLERVETSREICGAAFLRSSGGREQRRGGVCLWVTGRTLEETYTTGIQVQFLHYASVTLQGQRWASGAAQQKCYSRWIARREQGSGRGPLAPVYILLGIAYFYKLHVSCSHGMWCETSDNRLAIIG